jgi:hypothetical protein
MDRMFGLTNPRYTGCGVGDQFGGTRSFLTTELAGGRVPIDPVVGQGISLVRPSRYQVWAKGSVWWDMVFPKNSAGRWNSTGKPGRYRMW